MSRHCIISGGGSGLGLGLACRLLRRGDTLSILDLAITEERRQQLDAAAQAGGGRWHFYIADLTDAPGVVAAVAEAVSAGGAPQLAINSAGIAINRKLSDTRPEDFARVIQVNLGGSFHFARAVLPHMQAGARLALISSMAGVTSNYGYSAYGSSKFGVLGLATTLRYEYEPLGIHISCICPPEVKTPLVDAERADGDPVSLDLKLIAGSLGLDVACDEMLAGLDRGRWLIIPGRSARMTAFIARYFPRLTHGSTMLLVRRLMRKHQPGVQLH